MELNLKNYKTCELVNELRKRSGVEEHIAEPHELIQVLVYGPAIVLVVND